MADSIGVTLTGDNSKFVSMIDNSVGVANKFQQVLGTIGLGVSAGAVIGFFKDVFEKSGAIADLADRLTVSTDALQAFQFAARQAGANSEQVTQVFDKARKSIDELASGNTAAAETFGRIGLRAKDFIGLNLEQGLELIARGYRSNVSEAGAYDAVTDILGTKSAPKLNSASLCPLLDSCSECFLIFSRPFLLRLLHHGLSGFISALDKPIRKMVHSFWIGC